MFLQQKRYKAATGVLVFVLEIMQVLNAAVSILTGFPKMAYAATKLDLRPNRPLLNIASKSVDR